MLQVYGGEPPAASTGEANNRPTSPTLSGHPITFSPDTTLMLKARCTVAPLVSDTPAVKLKEPRGTATPEIVPEPPSVNPVGRLPETTDQVYGGLPPVAARVWVYGED
jgi:hypothetical protein